MKVTTTLLLLFFCGCLLAQSGGPYVIRDATVEGSSQRSSGGVFVKEISVGQGLAGPAISGGSFSVGGGFYPAPPPPPPAVPPDAPTSLVAAAASPMQIDLTWTAGSTNESGFTIERCKRKNCMNFVEVTEVDAGITSFADTGLERNTDYRYRVRAFNSAGTSSYSNVATAKTLRK